MYPTTPLHPRTGRIFLLALFAGTLTAAAAAQAAFDVASIRPTDDHVNFERNGTTEAAHGTLKMHDVTVATCIHWAYGIQLPLIHGPASLKDLHYDITAKTDPTATEEQMRLMLRTLLTERFKLAFHNEKTELRVYTLNIAKSGIKMHSADPTAPPSHQNSHIGVVGHAMTLAEITDYLSDALGAPLADATHLPGRYDFSIDFTPYVDTERTNNERPDPVVVLKAALKGEMGLEMMQSKETVATLVVDHVEVPTAN